MPEQRQDQDGQVYLAYYVSPFAFSWDGKSDHIEVAFGGAGEPVTHRVHYEPKTTMGLGTAMELFKLACDRWVRRIGDTPEWTL